MNDFADFDRQVAGFRDDFQSLCGEIAKRVVGRDAAIESLVTALVVGGHVLLEGLPGTGKTHLARSLAATVDLEFQRIQCTPDLLAADILGTYVVMETPQGRRAFEFRKGPLFANVVLADHVNRAPPRTQSALLQAMEEEAISVSTESFALPQPYLVIATQNPLESEGAYPLPEAQLDRFLFHVILSPAGPDDLDAILQRLTEASQPTLRRVVDGPRILEMRAVARRMEIPAAVRRSAVAIVAATHREHPKAPTEVLQFVRCGASPRGAQALILAAQVRALTAGRGAVEPSDLRALAHAALRHRLTLTADAIVDDVSRDAILDAILKTLDFTGQ